MPEVVETYRGIEIYRSGLNDSNAPHRYEARVGEWLLIGDLVNLRWQIDQHLDRAPRRASTPLPPNEQLQR